METSFVCVRVRHVCARAPLLAASGSRASLCLHAELATFLIVNLCVCAPAEPALC